MDASGYIAFLVALLLTLKIGKILGNWLLGKAFWFFHSAKSFGVLLFWGATFYTYATISDLAVKKYWNTRLYPLHMLNPSIRRNSTGAGQGVLETQVVPELRVWHRYRLWGWRMVKLLSVSRSLSRLKSSPVDLLGVQNAGGYGGAERDEVENRRFLILAARIRLRSFMSRPPRFLVCL